MANYARPAARKEGLTIGKAEVYSAMLEKGTQKETVAEIAGLTVAELDDLLSRF